VGYNVNEDFNGVLTPTGWSVSLNSGTLLTTDTLNSYGRSGTTGDIRSNNFTVNAGNRAQLNTKTFTATIGTETLSFDVAHATYPTYSDSLIIYTSSGSGFNRLIAWGSAQVIDTVTGITTANAYSAGGIRSYFVAMGEQKFNTSGRYSASAI
jgi:hypothetical protein